MSAEGTGYSPNGTPLIDKRASSNKGFEDLDFNGFISLSRKHLSCQGNINIIINEDESRKNLYSLILEYISKTSDPLYETRHFLNNLKRLERFYSEIDEFIGERNVIKELCLVYLLRHKVAYANLLNRFYERDEYGKKVNEESFTYALHNLAEKGYAESIPKNSGKYRDKRKKIEHFLLSKGLSTNLNQERAQWFCIRAGAEAIVSDNLAKLLPLLPETTRKKKLVDDIRAVLAKTHKGNERVQFEEVSKINRRITLIIDEIARIRNCSIGKVTDDIAQRIRMKNRKVTPEERLKEESSDAEEEKGS